jgi:hypothetical protein
MLLLDSPEALALLAEAVVPISVVNGLRESLKPFMERYLPLFYRAEQRELAAVVMEGKFSGLQRRHKKGDASIFGLKKNRCVPLFRQLIIAVSPSTESEAAVGRASVPSARTSEDDDGYGYYYRMLGDQLFWEWLKAN